MRIANWLAANWFVRESSAQQSTNDDISHNGLYLVTFSKEASRLLSRYDASRCSGNARFANSAFPSTPTSPIDTITSRLVFAWRDTMTHPGQKKRRQTTMHTTHPARNCLRQAPLSITRFSSPFPEMNENNQKLDSKLLTRIRTLVLWSRNSLTAELFC